MILVTLHGISELIQNVKISIIFSPDSSVIKLRRFFDNRAFLVHWRGIFFPSLQIFKQ